MSLKLLTSLLLSGSLGADTTGGSHCGENLVQGQNGNFKTFSKLLFYSRIIN